MKRDLESRLIRQGFMTGFANLPGSTVKAVKRVVLVGVARGCAVAACLLEVVKEPG